MNPNYEPDPDDFEVTRYRLLVRHASRLAELYAATKLPARLAEQATRPGFESVQGTATALGEMLVDHIEAEHAHARDVLYGAADYSDDARQTSRLNWVQHLLEQTEAVAAEVEADPGDDSFE